MCPLNDISLTKCTSWAPVHFMSHTKTFSISPSRSDSAQPVALLKNRVSPGHSDPRREGWSASTVPVVVGPANGQENIHISSVHSRHRLHRKVYLSVEFVLSLVDFAFVWEAGLS